MTITKNIIIEGKHNKPILADVFYIKSSHKKPIVIFAHGYKGYKDWGAWHLVAQTFADNGFVFLKFNFSHNGGTVAQPIDFPDLEAFGNNNFVIELDDLQSVIDWVFNSKDLQQEADMSSITLIGHSRGGGIVTIKAQEESRVNTVITWASVSDYGARFPKGAALEAWQKKGVSYIENSRTKQQMPHYFQFYQNFIQNRDRLNIKRAVKNLKKPHLIIHGQADETVKLQEAKNIHSWNPHSELYIVKNANHTFGSKHPWEDSILPKELYEVTQKSINFIRNN